MVWACGGVILPGDLIGVILVLVMAGVAIMVAMVTDVMAEKVVAIMVVILMVTDHVAQAFMPLTTQAQMASGIHR